MELKQMRPKTFETLESLWYEEERLATFIDWPVKFISEKDLAVEGFYYLRTKDHCACAFCRGIIGAWEEGDTPHEEHKRHFPHCPFVQGKPTPNVPLNQGRILSKMSRKQAHEENGQPALMKSEDVCGTGRCQRGTPGPITIKSPKGSEDISLKEFGFKEYCGPKRKDYLTLEARLRSFKHWPEKVKQRPEEMAEAGFYYCGLSDHVRCFHCANGLRNWEDDDKPWVEHARWYPDCHFVLLQKGVDFIDKVRRERPPYIPFHNSKESVSTSCGASSSSDTLTEEDFEQLMDLRIMKEVLSMGFAKNVVMTALSRKLKQTSVPFFTLEAAIEAILSVMDEETKRTIRGCEEITSQARKMGSIEESLRNNNSSSENESSSTTSIEPHSGSERVVESSQSTTETTAESLQQSGRETVEEQVVYSEYPPLPNNDRRISEGEDVVEQTSESSRLPPLPNNTRNYSSENSLPSLSIAGTSPPLRSSTPTAEVERSNNYSLQLDQETQNLTSTESSDSIRAEEPTVTTQNSESTSDEQEISSSTLQPLLNEADVAIKEADKLLRPPQMMSCSSSHQSNSSQDSGCEKDTEMESLTNSSEDEKEGECLSTLEADAANLAMELEKIKETRTCRVCMDREMDIVFLPCTHMVACSSCAVALSSCPICRRDIQYAFKPIIS